MNSLNLVKAGGDPKHFFDALAMSEREDRKASQSHKMIKMPSSSPELCWLAKELNWCTSQTSTAAHCHLDQFMLVRAHHMVFFLWIQAIHTNPRGASSYICHTNTYTGILIQKLFSAAFCVSMLRALLCYFQVKTEAALGFMKFLFWFQSLPQFTVGLAQATADLRNQMKRYNECYMICFRLYCMLLFVMVLWILSPSTQDGVNRCECMWMNREC